MLKYLLLGVGGSVGSILRFWLGSYIGSKMGTRFPYGTLRNKCHQGSFLIGLDLFGVITVEGRIGAPVYNDTLIPIDFMG